MPRHQATSTLTLATDKPCNNWKKNGSISSWELKEYSVEIGGYCGE